MSTLFLHGLDSSGFGTKGRFFAEHFPGMDRPDFEGSLEQRLERLKTIVSDREELVMVGSSFGGLMATCHAISYPQQVKRLILLAPALNFDQWQPPETLLSVECFLYIGEHDTVTPPNLVVPLSRKTFLDPNITIVDDDHLLHKSFYSLNWSELLS
ncbi:MAG: alpha/beta fold hydrolase [Desulfobulbaceae bacterium]|nr:MAG: alpha/beta fold hydrolase [Desulfobulbaceae bacterium]